MCLKFEINNFFLHNDAYLDHISLGKPIPAACLTPQNIAIEDLDYESLASIKRKSSVPFLQFRVSFYSTYLDLDSKVYSDYADVISEKRGFFIENMRPMKVALASEEHL
jgi:hypothetical protein